MGASSGGLLGGLGARLELLWGSLGLLWGSFSVSWGSPGPLFGLLGASCEHFFNFWTKFGVLGTLGELLLASGKHVYMI